MKWLHLSDLHIKENVDWNIYVGEVIKHCIENGPIDLVIVTGDFHDFADKDDFSLALFFLKEIMEKLELDISEDLFLIPGNHDGSWPIDEHKRGNVAVLKGDPTHINEKEWTELLSQFDAYEKFIKELIPEYPFEHPAREHCRIWHEKINFIHCNSAVVSDGLTKDNQILDINAFSKLSLDSKLPSIILMHNHIDDIHEKQRKRIIGTIRCSNIKAYFCGDRHIQEVKQINVMDKQNYQIPCVVSYKSAPDIRDEYSSYGVIIGTWEDEKAMLEGWTWTAEGGFVVDNIVTGQTIDMGVRFRDEVKNEEAMSIDNPIKMCSEKSSESPNNKSDCVALERKFRCLFFNMSEIQIAEVNKKFSANMRNLDKNETVESVQEFFLQAVEKGCANEILQFMNRLLKEM